WNDQPEGYLSPTKAAMIVDNSTAAMIPQEMEGCVIDEVAFYATDVEHLTNIRLFVTSKLSLSLEKFDIVLTPSELPTEPDAKGRWRVSAKLPEDYIVPFGGAYIGYQARPTEDGFAASFAWTDDPEGGKTPADKSLFIYCNGDDGDLFWVS
ncbi:MAG: hypothetical protein ACI3YT_08140, partial [Prevotella sp.]